MSFKPSNSFDRKWTALQRREFLSNAECFWVRSQHQERNYIELLESNIKTIQTCLTGDDTVESDYWRQFIIAKFAHDVWSGETLSVDADASTMALLQACTEQKNEDFVQCAKELGIRDPDRCWTKLDNLLAVCSRLFCDEIDKSQTCEDLSWLTVEWLRGMHADVMRGILEDAGKIRRCRAKPIHSSFEYTMPNDINVCLDRLLKFARSQYNKHFTLKMLFFLLHWCSASFC